MSIKKFPVELTTVFGEFPNIRRMAKVTKIHHSKTPSRIHYIAEWIDHRGLRQVDILNAMSEAGFTEINKGTISKWCSGKLPSEKYLVALADVLSVDPNDLFREPNNDWIKRMFDGRAKEEIERMKVAMEAIFPIKSA